MTDNSLGYAIGFSIICVVAVVAAVLIVAGVTKDPPMDYSDWDAYTYVCDTPAEQRRPQQTVSFYHHPQQQILQGSFKYRKRIMMMVGVVFMPQHRIRDFTISRANVVSPPAVVAGTYQDNKKFECRKKAH